MPRRKRVDELEEEVAELKATVQGLTEELVEAHERLRQIERALAGDPQAARDAAREAVDVAADSDDASAGADPEEVARAAATVEADKREGTEGSDEAGGDVDDIIVA